LAIAFFAIRRRAAYHASDRGECRAAPGDLAPSATGEAKESAAKRRTAGLSGQRAVATMPLGASTLRSAACVDIKASCSELKKGQIRIPQIAIAKQCRRT